MARRTTTHPAPSARWHRRRSPRLRRLVLGATTAVAVVAPVAPVAPVHAATIPNGAALGAVAGTNCATEGAAASRRSGGVDHVVWIVFENKGTDLLLSSPNAPTFRALASTCSLTTNGYGITHPSMPNYLALASGRTWGITDDRGPSSHQLAGPTVFDQLAGSWRIYADAMPYPCAWTSNSRYVARHNPATYFTSLRSTCAARDVPLPRTGALDLSAALTMIVPDLVHDMHVTASTPHTAQQIGAGDAFLASLLPRITATPQYRSGRTVVFITFDENENPTKPNRIATFAIAPGLTATRSTATISHYGLLRTTQDLLGIGPLHHSAEASPAAAALGL